MKTLRRVTYRVTREHHKYILEGMANDRCQSNRYTMENHDLVLWLCYCNTGHHKINHGTCISWKESVGA